MIPFLHRFFGFKKKPLASFGKTDTGQVRSSNEDAFAVRAEQGLFLVADGMGGHQAGEIASKMAITCLRDCFTRQAVSRMHRNTPEIHHFFIQNFREANRLVSKEAATNPARKGMGCTLVAAFFDNDILHTCHVGDSRCYLVRGTDCLQLTTDHVFHLPLPADSPRSEKPSADNASPRQDERLRETSGKNPEDSEKLSSVNGHPQQDQGVHASASAHNPPVKRSSIITRAIGHPMTEDPEYRETLLVAGDKIVLCTDGLWDMVSNAEIAAVTAKAATPQEAVEELIRRANQAGGRDNITAVIIFA